MTTRGIWINNQMTNDWRVITVESEAWSIHNRCCSWIHARAYATNCRLWTFERTFVGVMCLKVIHLFRKSSGPGSQFDLKDNGECKTTLCEDKHSNEILCLRNEAMHLGRTN